MSPFRSGCDVVKKSVEPLVEYVTVGGVRRREEYFRDVLWLQESESRVVFIHGGQVVRDASTWCDVHGYLQSMKSAADVAATLATDFAVTADSSLEIVVRTTVYLVPCCETDETRQYNHKRQPGYVATYASVSRGWLQEVEVDGEKRLRSLERIAQGQAITWSSRCTEAGNREARDQFRRTWPATAISPTEQA